MSKLILVTGGARSGKSSFAEQKAKFYGQNVLYIATSKPIDAEMIQRIEKHRADRPAEWETMEEYKDFDIALTGKTGGLDAVLLDCITIMVTNLMLDEFSDWDNITREQAAKVEQKIQVQLEKLINVSRSTSTPFILVTNEVGMGLVPPYALGRDFRDIAGRMNQLIARAADEVYFLVSGIPMKIK